MATPKDAPTPKSMWEARYGVDQFLYGKDPNQFLKSRVQGLPRGSALCIADGEGRNGVYLASLGHRVTSMDLTEAGMAKASALAAEHGVQLDTVVADLATFDLGTRRWDLIVSVFAHTPPPIRRRVHAAIAKALTPDGRFVLEAYTPDQIGRGTGGPPNPDLTMTLAGLTEELIGLEVIQGAELVREVIEGGGHTGEGAVVQVVATRSR